MVGWPPPTHKAGWSANFLQGSRNSAAGANKAYLPIQTVQRPIRARPWKSCPWGNYSLAEDKPPQSVQRTSPLQSEAEAAPPPPGASLSLFYSLLLFLFSLDLSASRSLGLPLGVPLAAKLRPAGLTLRPECRASRGMGNKNTKVRMSCPASGTCTSKPDAKLEETVKCSQTKQDGREEGFEGEAGPSRAAVVPRWGRSQYAPLLCCPTDSNPHNQRTNAWSDRRRREQGTEKGRLDEMRQKVM